MLNDLLDRVGFPMKSCSNPRPNEFDQIYPLSEGPSPGTSSVISTKVHIDAIRQEIRSLRKTTKELNGLHKVHTKN
ncbi:hypothetical protein BVRB_030000, partial [Beta vulgaris subsp. vulgaris]